MGCGSSVAVPVGVGAADVVPEPPAPDVGAVEPIPAANAPSGSDGDDSGGRPALGTSPATGVESTINPSCAAGLVSDSETEGPLEYAVVLEVIETLLVTPAELTVASRAGPATVWLVLCSGSSPL
jgi:hypothetical protein